MLVYHWLTALQDNQRPADPFFSSLNPPPACTTGCRGSQQFACSPRSRKQPGCSSYLAPGSFGRKASAAKSFSCLLKISEQQVVQTDCSSLKHLWCQGWTGEGEEMLFRAWTYKDFWNPHSIFSPAGFHFLAKSYHYINIKNPPPHIFTIIHYSKSPRLLCKCFLGRDFPPKVLLSDHLRKQTEDCSVETQCTEWAKHCPDITLNLCYSPADAVQLMEPCWHALEGQTRTRIRDKSQNLERFCVELSMLLNLFWVLQKSSVCMYLHMHACVLLPVMEVLALYGKVRNMPSFPSSSTQNIFVSFAFLLGFLGLWSPQGKIQSSWAQQSPWHWAEWLGWLVHHTQYSSVSHCISPRYLNSQLRSGLAVLLLFLFTSLFFKLHQSTWALGPQLCQEH